MLLLGWRARPAVQAFGRLSDPIVFSWTALIAGGQGHEAFRLYRRMREDGGRPDRHTFVSLLKACGSRYDLKEARRIHAEVLKSRCESDLFVSTCLVVTYGKCGSVVDAENVFAGLVQRNVVSWTAMLAVYGKHGEPRKALQVYDQMREEGVSPDGRTFVIVLEACGLLAEEEYGIAVGRPCMKAKSLQMGKALHAAASTRRGFEFDAAVAHTLIGMYCKCGSVMDAQRVFDGLHQQDVVSWNGMLLACCQQGLAVQVVQLYDKMLQDGVSPNVQTFMCLLQAYGRVAEKEDGVGVGEQGAKLESLEKVKALHANALKRGYDSELFVWTTLMSTYGKCASFMEAQDVFDGLPQRDVVSWNAMLAVCAQCGQAEKALQLYEQMSADCVTPNDRTFVTVLQACGMLAERGKKVVDKHMVNVKVLEQGKAIHSEVRKKGYESDVFVGNSLVSMYGKCGSILDTQYVFDRLSHRTVVVWTTMLAAHLQQGEAEKAMELYEQMREEGVSPNNRTLVNALEACGMVAEREKNFVDGQSTKAKVLRTGKVIHRDAQMKGYDADVFVGSALISMYGKCGSLMDAQDVFDRLLQRDVVSWNAMIAAYAQQGQADKALHMYTQMQQAGVKPNDRTFVSVLQACGMLAEKAEQIVDGPLSKGKFLEWGKAIHADVEKSGYHSDVFVGNTLISMYGKCGNIVDAKSVFDRLLQRNVVTWNAMIATYVENGQERKALKLYKQMKEEGVSWDARTSVSVLQACCVLAEKEYVEDGTYMKFESLRLGRVLHADAQKKGFDSDVFVGNTLISMYGKCRSILDAQRVFDSLSRRSLVSWNVMLAAFVEQGHAEKTLQLYKQMQDEGIDPNLHTFLSTLHACGVLAEEEALMNESAARSKNFEMAKAIHADARKKGYHSDVFIGSTLISMYRRCGSIADAQKAFDEVSQHSVVSWTAILVAYAQQDQGEKVLELYRQMQDEGVSLDDIAMGCILQSCSSKGGLEICREIHETATSNGNNLGPLLATTLIHAYGRCASMVDAQIVFDSLSQPDVVSWSALIAGHAREGNYLASVRCYEEMQRRGVKPDAVTFLSLLSACSHAGLVDKGVEVFESMSKDHGITPGIEHYVSMVDLLGRAGYFHRIEQLLMTMPMQPDLAMWLCLLGACRKYGKVALGERAFAGAVRLRPQESAAYVLMLNIYTDAGLLDCAKEVKELRQNAGAWKKPGQSWIENEQGVNAFLVRDGKHPQQEQLYDLLGVVGGELEKRHIARTHSDEG